MQIYPAQNINPTVNTDMSEPKLSFKTRMDRFEEEFVNQGGDRAQLHNIYKVPLVSKIQSLQMDASKELSRITAQYDALIAKKSAEISETERRLAAINEGESPIGAIELNSDTSSRELREIIENKKRLLHDVIANLRAEVANANAQLQSSALESIKSK